MSRLSVTANELQDQHPEEKRQSDFQNHLWAYLVVRPLSFYIAPVFITVGLSATQITAVGAVVLVFGLIFLGFGSSFAYLIVGAFLINTWYLLDFVDGVVARYSSTTTAFGAFLDWLVGIIYHISLPFAVAGILYRSDIYSLTEVTGVFWFTVATIQIIFYLVRWMIRYKTEQLVGRSNEGSSNNQWTTLGTVSGAISSFKAPLLLLSIVFGTIDIWLIGYTVYYIVIFGPEMLIYIRRLHRYDLLKT